MKRLYNSPQIEKIKLDNNIALVMMSPIGDPPSSIETPTFNTTGTTVIESTNVEVQPAVDVVAPSTEIQE